MSVALFAFTLLQQVDVRFLAHSPMLHIHIQTYKWVHNVTVLPNGDKFMREKLPYARWWVRKYEHTLICATECKQLPPMSQVVCASHRVIYVNSMQ